MSDILKKSLLLVATSAGMLSLSSAIADSAFAAPYASGSLSVTNINGSTISFGAELGGAYANEVNVGATITANNGSYEITAFNVNSSLDEVSTIGAGSVSAQVANDLNDLTDLNNTAENLNAYVSIVKAAAGAKGLD